MGNFKLKKKGKTAGRQTKGNSGSLFGQTLIFA
jgi:hypothetical protein